MIILTTEFEIKNQGRRFISQTERKSVGANHRTHVHTFIPRKDDDDGFVFVVHEITFVDSIGRLPVNHRDNNNNHISLRFSHSHTAAACHAYLLNYTEVLVFCFLNFYEKQTDGIQIVPVI